MTARGLLLVLEGVEGVGKSTQWQRIGDTLRAAGHTVVSLREPGGTDVGDAVRKVVLNSPITVSDRTEALLFAASRAEIIAQVIQPALQRGDVVLLDRFLLSTYAYQGSGRLIDMNKLREINAFATRGVVPDITLLLTMPLDAALRRASSRSASDRIEQEDRAFHSRVAAAFHDATTREWQAKYPECGNIVLVDATGSAQDVTNRCIAQLAANLPQQFGTLQDFAPPSSLLA